MSGRFSEAARAVLTLASTLAEKDRSISVQPRHLLAALTIDGSSDAALILQRHGYRANVKYLEQDATFESVASRLPHFAEHTNAIVQDASGLATSREAEASPTDIALAILRSGDQRVLIELTEQSIDVNSVIRALLFDVVDAQIDVAIFDNVYQPARWSQEGDRIVRSAQFESAIFRNDYIGTEHILLSLLRDSDNPAAHFLETRYLIPITIVGMSSAVKAVGGCGGCTANDNLRLTTNANRLLTTSQLAARRVGRDFVGSEHILFAVLSNRGSIAARALSKRVSLDRLEKDLEAAFGQR